MEHCTWKTASFFCFLRFSYTQAPSEKEVSVNDMISLILKQTEFTPENASHFPKMGGERD